MIFLFIYHVETYLQLNICHVETLLHMTICHMEKFLHMTDFFSTSTAGGAGDKYQVCSHGLRIVREGPQTPTEWKYESVCDQLTDRLTGVGARDAWRI